MVEELNLASLKAAKTGISPIFRKSQRSKFGLEKISSEMLKLKIITAGANPKVMKSAKESNCAPNLDSTFSFLAENQSK